MTDPTPDFRKLCAELVCSVELLLDMRNSVRPMKTTEERLNRARAALPNQSALIKRANDALATPPPEPPTDEELWETGDDFFQANYYPTDAIKFARAVLKKWGK